MTHNFDLYAQAEISPYLILMKRFIVCRIEATSINNERSGTLFIFDMPYKCPGKLKASDDSAYEK